MNPPVPQTSARAPQPGILREGASAGMNIEWQLAGNAATAWAALAALDTGQAVIGIGAPLVAAVGARCPGLHPFRSLSGTVTFPSTQAALWALVTGHSPGEVFDRASALIARLDGHFRVVELTPTLRYRDGRDLTGYVDGTENPVEAAAQEAALIADGELAGGSFALVQRYLHFRRRFLHLPQTTRDDIIGRRMSDDEELEDAPESAHVKRTAQESFVPPAFMVRRSMPWGDPQRNGLQFIAFVRDAEPAERMLARMAGLEDGTADALMAHSQAETGAWYYCPPLAGVRLLLPAVSAAAPDRASETGSAAPAPPGTAMAAGSTPAATVAVPPSVPATNSLQLLENGPLVLAGDLRIGAGRRERHASLCRCGHSADKPWCDGSHLQSGFHASGQPVPPGLCAFGGTCSGPLHIRAMRDGPLVVEGRVQVVSGSGTAVAGAHDPVLCRCGHSASKPWCDGSHAGARFRADAD